MKLARRFDDRILIGGVPDADDLAALSAWGFRRLVDVRGEQEKRSGFVRTACLRSGMVYVSIPILRDAITTENVLAFYDEVNRDEELVYCFSRFGKRPLALLLLFEAISKGKPMAYVYKRAASFGFNLEGDLLLDTYIVHYFNSLGVRNKVGKNGLWVPTSESGQPNASIPRSGFRS